MNPVTVNLDHTLVSVSSSSMKSSAETNNGTKKDEAESRMLIPMSKVSSEAAALVLAGCRSLILIDGETTGDPLESAAFKAMRWEVASKSGKLCLRQQQRRNRQGCQLLCCRK